MGYFYDGQEFYGIGASGQGDIWDDQNKKLTVVGNGGGTPPALSNTRINSYDTVDAFMQNNVQNLSATANASSDWIASADNATDTVNYVDLGINGSAYSVGTWTINGSNDAYLYAQSGGLAVGTATSGKDLVLFSGGTLAANEMLRLKSTGDMYLAGVNNRTFNVQRTPTANTAGSSLNISAGGATSGATDKAAGTLNLQPGQSTGTGTSLVKLQRNTRASSTGTTDNSTIDALLIPCEINMTNSSANSLFDVTLPTLGMAGGTFNWTVQASDGTDMQAMSGVCQFQEVNKAAAYTGTIQIIGTNTSAVSAGTLTVAFSVVTGTNKITIKCTPTSSLTPTTLKINLMIFNGTAQTITLY